jgi:hypothetical protein
LIRLLPNTALQLTAFGAPMLAILEHPTRAGRRVKARPLGGRY